jgi:hypothetical protein
MAAESSAGVTGEFYRARFRYTVARVIGDDGLVHSTHRSRNTVLLLIAAASIGALTGCGAEIPKPASTSTQQPSEAATPTEPAVEEPAQTTGAPVTIKCSELISAETMYEFNPNFGLQSDFTPDSGSTAATMQADQGIACSWVNQTSGETIVISAANPGPADLTARAETLATTSKPAPELGPSAWFTRAAGVGMTEVITETHWLAASSTYFYEAMEVAPLLDAAKAALGE